MIRKTFSIVGALFAVLWLASCSTTMNSAGVADSAVARSATHTGAAYQAAPPSAAGGQAWKPPAPGSRPGLGTTWGETQRDKIRWGDFDRASSSPSGVASLYYNDEEGAKAMANHAGYRSRSDGRARSSDGAVTVSLKSGLRTLSGYYANGKEFVIGRAGQKYAIHIKNNTDRRIEVVVSVDGLDVIDGRSASYRKRGYLLNPKGSVSIKGFRRSTDEVAAFKFGSVGGSYANLKHGDTRNVGVVGVAVFSEKTPDEVHRRFAADPFSSSPN